MSVFLVEGQNSEDLYKAYLLAGLCSCFSVGYTIIPTSVPEVSALVAESLTFLNYPCTRLSVNEAEALIESQARELLTSFRERSSLKKLPKLPVSSYQLLYPEKYLQLAKTSQVTMASTIAGQAVVVAVSEEGLQQALPFALLTGRTLLYAENLDQLDGAFFKITQQATSFYVALPSDLKVDELEQLFAAKEDSLNPAPLGVFYPFGYIEREFFALKSFLFERYQLTSNLPFNFFYPLETKSQIIEVGQMAFLVGKVRNKADILRRLTSPAEYLFATPHSNGVDMSLGEVVLCARKNYGNNGSLTKVMPCFRADVCNRKTQTNELLAPSALRSKVVFLYTCWGVLLRKSVYDVETSLAYQLAGSPYTAAILTTYSMSLLDRAAGLLVADLYSKNESLGRAVRDFNSYHFEKYQDTPHVVILFGDPEFRRGASTPFNLHDILTNNNSLSSFLQASGTQLYNSSFSSNLPPPLPDSFFAQINYTRCVVNGTKLLQLEPFKAPLEELSASSEQLWMSGMLFNSRLQQQNRFRFDSEQMLTLLARNFQQFHQTWFNLYKSMVNNLGGYVRLQVDRYFTMMPLAEKKASQCSYCGTELQQCTQEMVGNQSVRRRLMECLNCATVFDGLEHFQMGRIQCSEFWRLSTPQLLRVMFVCSNATFGQYFVGALLEPFNKKENVKMPRAFTSGALSKSNGITYTVELPEMFVPSYLTPGCYHLNVLVLVDEKVLLLRRFVYLEN
ncbi:hypothetical protein MICAH_40002 [Microcystis aeruginosa PCC 9809]|jgi:hypothetical protein|uniref:Uncharacterized protein n=1 Tax=Microcystis aeruginosa PCC 9809 TaxID=1160285 RepID=I4HWR6_MICAE|nr:hypothetical protein [Microcystis aeruginosa]CCI26490.1 hypothetical protein MICAH_40002 [Microcystis aeruginosa PCC 9809]